MTQQSGLQTIGMHILPNVSQSKGKLTIKFGQLIEYNCRNIFLQIVCRKWGKETCSLFIFLKSLKAGFQHADFSASADFYACADFSAYPHLNFHHNAGW